LCHLWADVEKYGRSRQATDGNVIWRMRFACLITKAADTLRVCNSIAFQRQQWLHEHSMLLYTHIVLLMLLLIVQCPDFVKKGKCISIFVTVRHCAMSVFYQVLHIQQTLFQFGDRLTRNLCCKHILKPTKCIYTWRTEGQFLMVLIYVTFEKCRRNNVVCHVTEVKAKRVGLQVTGV
jgi:hypothetical protein